MWRQHWQQSGHAQAVCALERADGSPAWAAAHPRAARRWQESLQRRGGASGRLVSGGPGLLRALALAALVSAPRRTQALFPHAPASGHPTLQPGGTSTRAAWHLAAAGGSSWSTGVLVGKQARVPARLILHRV